MFNKTLKVLVSVSLLVMVTMAIMLFSKKAKANEQEPIIYHICQIKTGDVGDFKYRGVDYEDAMTKVSMACLDARVDMYVRARKEKPSTERKILFAENCVNNSVCWRKK